MSWFFNNSQTETKECPSDPVIMVEHQVGAVCALVADILRLADAVSELKSQFNPNMLEPGQRSALRECFEACQNLMGPDVEDSDTEEEAPDTATPQNPVDTPNVNTATPPNTPNVSPAVIPTLSMVSLSRSIPQASNQAQQWQERSRNL